MTQAMDPLPRSIVVGNGNVLVAFDADYSLRDIFFPQVGLENHTGGNLCRTGVFLDGRTGPPRIAYLFPGQGGCAVGAIRRRFALADSVVRIAGGDRRWSSRVPGRGGNRADRMAAASRDRR